VGVAQPPLTDEEVVAAIRGWVREHVKADDAVFASSRKIADTGRFPAGAQLDFTTGWAGFRAYDFDVWWIDLSIRGYTYRIWDHQLRCRPTQAEDARDARGRKRSSLRQYPRCIGASPHRPRRWAHALTAHRRTEPRFCYVWGRSRAPRSPFPASHPASSA
jgi:hypothetical protein